MTHTEKELARHLRRARSGVRGNQDSEMQKPKEEMLQRGGGQLLLKADEIKKTKKNKKKNQHPLDME